MNPRSDWPARLRVGSCAGPVFWTRSPAFKKRKAGSKHEKAPHFPTYDLAKTPCGYRNVLNKHSRVPLRTVDKTRRFAQRRLLHDSIPLKQHPLSVLLRTKPTPHSTLPAAAFRLSRFNTTGTLPYAGRHFPNTAKISPYPYDIPSHCRHYASSSERPAEPSCVSFCHRLPRSLPQAQSPPASPLRARFQCSTPAGPLGLEYSDRPLHRLIAVLIPLTARSVRDKPSTGYV